MISETLFPASFFWSSVLILYYLLSLYPSVGNKLDVEDREVTDETVDVFMEQFPMFKGYYKISCRTNEGVDEMINEVVQTLSSSSFSFKEVFDTFTLHGQHTQGSCCSKDGDPNHVHAEESSGGSCCAK